MSVFCAALYMISVLTSFISIQLKSTTRCRYTVAAPGGRHRQLIFNGCRLPALEELGTTWNTVWWLNRVVRNQLGETFGIKVTGSNSSLLSAGSRSSEGIKYCFGSQKLLFPISVILHKVSVTVWCLHRHQHIKEYLSVKQRKTRESYSSTHDKRSGC